MYGWIMNSDGLEITLGDCGLLAHVITFYERLEFTLEDH